MLFNGFLLMVIVNTSHEKALVIERLHDIPSGLTSVTAAHFSKSRLLDLTPDGKVVMQIAASEVFYSFKIV